MNQFVIEKDIPMEIKSKNAGLLEVARAMQVGDSVFLPGETTAKFCTAKTLIQRKTHFHFASRKVDGGIRFWRTE